MRVLTRGRAITRASSSVRHYAYLLKYAQLRVPGGGTRNDAYFGLHLTERVCQAKARAPTYDAMSDRNSISFLPSIDVAFVVRLRGASVTLPFLCHLFHPLQERATRVPGGLCLLLLSEGGAPRVGWAYAGVTWRRGVCVRACLGGCLWCVAKCPRHRHSWWHRGGTRRVSNCQQAPLASSHPRVCARRCADAVCREPWRRLNLA